MTEREEGERFTSKVLSNILRQERVKLLKELLGEADEYLDESFDHGVEPHGAVVQKPVTAVPIRKIQERIEKEQS